MDRRKKRVNCLISFLLSAVLVFSTFPGCMISAEAETVSAGTVTVAVERFSIGQGYLIQPYVTTFQRGDTYETICRRVLQENGYSYDTKGASFYLSGINGADAGTISIPSCIKTIGAKKIGIKNVEPPDNSAKNEYAGNLAWLGEFSYSRMSGWMYSVGNDEGYEYPGVGMDGKSPKDGDVFRLQFTVWGYGEDLTGCSYSDKTKVYYPVGDKTALTRKIAQINQKKSVWFCVPGCEAAYYNAITVLQKLDASQSELDYALAQLPEEEPVFPNQITLQKTQADLSPGDTLKLHAVLSPENVNQSSLEWVSSDGGVVSVDSDGLVTALGVGTADITVKTQNQKTAVCHVTVKDRKITKIILNQTTAWLKMGDSVSIHVEKYEPENATEKLSVTYASSDASVASVNASGKVTALKNGEAVITVRTQSGVSAECKIMVGTPKELAKSMETKITALSSAGAVTEETAQQIQKVWDEYLSLSDEVQKEMSAESVEELHRLKQEADVVIEKQKQVERVRDRLTDLPSPERVSLSDETVVREVRSAYEDLDTEQQRKLDADLIRKLKSLEEKIRQLKTEADTVQKKITDFADRVTVGNVADAVDLWKRYSSLAADQKAYLNEEAAERMEEIADWTVSCVNETVASVDQTKPFDLSSKQIQSFIVISNACDAMEAEQLNRLSEKTTDSIKSIRQWIGDQIHTSGGLSVTAAWYVCLTVKNGTENSSWKKAVTEKYSSFASIAFNKIISYQDIRSGTTYTPDRDLELKADLSEAQNLNNPCVNTLTAEGSSVVLKELESQITDNSITFKTSHTGALLIVSNPIRVTKISVPPEEYVGIGNTISLEVDYTPFNATTDRTVVIKSSDPSIVKVTGDGMLKGISPGSVKVTVSLKSDASITAFCKVTVTDKANKLKKSVDQVRKETSEYMLSIDKDPTVGSEWFVLGLARGGKSLKSKYFQTYYNHLANYLEEKDGKLTNSVKYTEYSKQILVMTAIGKDARNIAGYNLLENLADFAKITEQGFNGPIWALIALNCNPDYTIPKVSGVSEQTTEQKLIDYLLEGEIAGGGWSLQGDEPDTDITAMTLQALAPYYNKEGYGKVTAAIDRGVNRLSKMQLKTGGFGTMGAETLESNAQVITALCALGIDPRQDARFIKNGRWTVENLISYHIDGSGFMHVKAGAATNGGGEGGVVNGMATEQGYYALVAYQRFCDGKTSLYDMSDLTAQKGEKGDGSGTGISDPKESQTGGNTQPKGSSVGKTLSKTENGTQKTSSAKTESSKKEAKGWSFEGKTYTPDNASDDTQKESPESENDSERTGMHTVGTGLNGIWKRENITVLLVFILGAALGACIVFAVGRRRRNEKKI